MVNHLRVIDEYNGLTAVELLDKIENGTGTEILRLIDTIIAINYRVKENRKKMSEIRQEVMDLEERAVQIRKILYNNGIDLNNFGHSA